jgi:hypothetical protein
MESYIQSDYLAKLLLPNQQPKSGETIRIKDNLAARTMETDESENVDSKSTNWLDISTYTKPSGSWADIDFTKSFFTSTQEEESDNQEEESDQGEIEETPDFSYLDPENMDLEYDFELCDTTFSNTAIYTIHLCGYSISTECELPFLKYFMELNGETFIFPHFDFTCPSNISNASGFLDTMWNNITGNKELEKIEPVESYQSDQSDQSDERSPGHIYLLNECFKRILSMVDASDHSNPDLLKNMYKGFISSKTEPNVLYVFFDFGDLSIKSNEYHRSWAIMDEILYLKKMLGFSVDPKITRLFNENAGLTRIIDKSGFIVDSPYSLYLCSLENGSYNNIYSDDDDGDESLLDERCDHPSFGDFYLFSMALIDIQGKSSHFKIKRCAGFENNTIYILKNISTLEKNETLVNGYDSGSIYFQENIATANGVIQNVPLLIIKSSDDFCDI